MEVGCPYCGGANTVDTGVSTRFQCAHCANLFEVGVPQQAQADTAAVLSFLAAKENEIGFRCPFCKTKRRPNSVTTITTGGWIFFWMMLFMCFPLCFIGLAMRQQETYCSSCRTRLG